MNRQKLTTIGFCFSLLLLGAISVKGADLVGVYPVTNQILMVEFNEGHVDYDVFGNENANVSYYSALNTTNAGNKANYTLTSTNDANYTTGKQPSNIGRKAKAKEFNRIGGAPPYILTHYIYIELPNALVRGKAYKLTLNNLGDNSNEFSFIYDEKNLLSPALHVNQVGFVTNGVKYAYLSQWMGTFNTTTHSNGGLNLNGFSAAQFQLIRVSDNAVVFTGGITKQADKATVELTNGNFSTTPNSTKADVWQCDFSTFSNPGTYKIAVDGIGCSYPFAIGDDVYRTPFNYVMRGIFTQRQGVDKELEGGQVYPRGHTDIKYVGTTTSVNLYGYYYDAGDWDGHNRHIGVPLDLMLLYDMKPGNFRDGDVANKYRINSTSAWINEGTDGLPDILNEARWLLDFYKRAKGALTAIGRGTGGVPGGAIPGAEGLIGPDAGCENRASWTDTRTAYVNGEQTENTYNYAAAAAYYAICLQKFYGVSSNTEINLWISEATSAFNWADNRSDDEGTDGCKKAKSIASASLFRLTGTVSYQDHLKRLIALDTSYPSHDCWQNPWPWQYAAMIYGLTPDGTANLDVAYRTTLRNAIINKANSDEAVGSTRGMRMSFPAGRMGSNGAFSTPRVYFCAFAHQITGDVKYLKTIQNTTSNTLGGNQNNMVYVAQLGHNPDNATFHPDSWRLLDYNSKVYKGTSLPGQVNYYAMQNCDFFGCGYNWTVDEDFSRSAANPGIDSWPAGEWRMNNKYSIAGSEFTMNESFGPAAFAYGYLAGSAPTQAYTQNARPTVSLNLTENQDFRKEGCDLKVTASADVWSVKYYYDWHYIGESFDKANNFKFYWVSPLANGTVTDITAVAYDIQGQRSNPSANGDRRVTIRTGASCVTETIPVTGIIVTPATTTLGFGATTQLTYEVQPANATNKNVTVTNSNSAVASINSSNLITAGSSAGTTTITVTTQEGGFSDQCVVTVQDILPTSVSVAPTSASIGIGQTVQLTPTVLPAEATNKNVTWTSNNTSATVSSTGLVTGVSEGTAIITAKTVVGNYTATSTVTILPPQNLNPLVKLALDENTGTATVNSGTGGGTFTRTTPTPAWSTNTPANVGGTSSVDFGTTTGNYVVESSAVMPTLQNLSSFTIALWVNCKSSSVGAGGNRLVSWINNGGDGADLVYNSNGSITLSVDQWPDGISGSSASKVTTNSSAPATNWVFIAVTYSGSQVQYYFGNNSTNASLDVTRAYNRGAVGSNIGKLAVGHFNSSLRASATDRMFRGLIDNVQIFDKVLSQSEIIEIQTGSGGINVPVDGISLNKSSLSLNLGPCGPVSEGLIATISPNNATNKNVIWTTSNSGVATVSASGNITAVGTGTAVITATSEDNNTIKATCNVTVTATIPATGVTVSPSSSTILVNGTVQLSHQVLPVCLPQNVSWSSNNTAIATVSSTGLVTGISTGTAVITVTSQDGSKSATSSITVGDAPQCTLYQAETGYTGSSVVVATNQAGYTGSGFLDYGGQNSYAEWTVSVPATGSYTFKFRHGNGSTGNRQCEFRANGSAKGNVAFAPTGSWTTWSIVEFTTSLNAGNNVIRLVANTSAGGPNLDNYEVCGSSVNVPVTGVTLSPTTASINVGSTQQLTPTVAPGNATNKNVTWSTSNASIATVSTSGLVTGVAAGTATITVTTVDGNKTSTSVITVNSIPTPDCLLTNPSFESDLQAWTINSGTIAISTSATDGVKSARLYGTNAGMEQGYTDNVAQGTAVTLSFDAQIAGTVGWAGVGLDFKDANNADLLKQQLQITNTSWQSKTITANAPAGTVKLNVWAYTSSGELYVDNFCISGDLARSLTDATLITQNEQAKGVNLKLYPNPVINGELTLEFDSQLSDGNLTASVYSISGKIELSVKIDALGITRYTIPCQSLSKGMYLLHLQGSTISQRVKFIVQ